MNLGRLSYKGPKHEPGGFVGRSLKGTFNRKTQMSWNLEGQIFGANETKADVFNRNRKELGYCGLRQM